ncbi:MAG: glycine cleavage system protein [Ferruginibacter sp.]|nr:glycine cleavage system protein [Ferruginibacter sp.]
MQLPLEYKYSKEHTWLKLLEEGEALVGITDFAQSELGEIVYVDLPSIGKRFKKDEIFGSIEAVKTTSDLYMPAAGEIIQINLALKDQADLVNSASFSEGWLVKIKLIDSTEPEPLLDSHSYERLTGRL